MKNSLRTRAARWLADWINERADLMRDELRNHIRDENRRITLAEKRVRGLRLYIAWCGARRHHHSPVLRNLPATA